jgi:DNA-binding phage protein
MRDREADQGGVTYRVLHRYEGLDCEEAIAGYLEEAQEDDDLRWQTESMAIVGVAHLINQIAAATGIDRQRLCAAFDGGPLLDRADTARALDAVAAVVAPVAVG